MPKPELPIVEQEKIHISTRVLLLITAWVAVSFAAVLSNHSLLLFHIARLISLSVVLISAIVPMFLELKKRKFWNAFSVAIIVHLSFLCLQDHSNPVASEMATIVCRLLGLDGHYTEGIYGIDYSGGKVDQFTAICFLIEIHFVPLFGCLVGALWQGLEDRTPIWIVVAWGLYIAMDISSDSGLHLSFFSLLFVFALLPALVSFKGVMRPFWTAFGFYVFIVGIEFATAKSYDFSYYVNDVVAMVAPDSSARMAESIAFIAVPVSAAMVGLIVQAIVQKQGAVTFKKHD